MIRFVPLTPELLGWAVRLNGDAMTRELAAANPEYVSRLVAGVCVAEAMLDGGRLLGVGGITQHWPGRAEAWMMIVPDATRRERASGLRRCQENIALAQEDPAFRRIEMYLLASAPWCVAFGRL